MSERITADYDDGDDGCWITDQEEQGSVFVPAADCARISLIMLGDRDALVERAARAYFNAYWDADHYHPTPYSAQSELDKEQYRTVARAVLAAIGGGGEQAE